jgi:DNA (cytosine-5)-methyltransferase 1
MLTHFSLFSGIGGLDLAAEMAGFQTVGQCEWADYPTKVLEKHWPDVPRWRDIRNVTAEGFYSKTGLRTITVISGGFPCQPFSTAGSRKGDKDDRYLWPEMLRVISELKPTWVIGENVGGLISMAQSDCEIKMETETAILKDFEMVLETIRRDFERIGYESQPILIPACAVGARHRRDRTFIMAYSESSNDRRNTGTFQGKNEQQAPKRQEKWATKSCSTSKDVADTEGELLDRRITNNNEARWFRPANSSEIVADICSQGLQRSKQCGNNDPKTVGRPQGSTGAITQRSSYEWGYWSTEPELGRVADGIPNRVDRIGCLGNAVVPQQAFPIFQAIADIERGST